MSGPRQTAEEVGRDDMWKQGEGGGKEGLGQKGACQWAGPLALQFCFFTLPRTTLLACIFPEKGKGIEAKREGREGFVLSFEFGQPYPSNFC